MAEAKKFGTFAGVFTPSILTILGVIMYLRLGWVIGEAGLYSALALIFIAHIISVTTGLSLSSIATDKKIKTGGIYYMLSRSLGLPMGGSIGITLFLGTALSISLYIVGFVENFLSIESIQAFLHMSGSINEIRLIGTFVIIVLVILAYISTSIAIKTQFFILGAIALSLVSIIVGIFTNTDMQAVTPSLMPSANSPDLIVIFAVFFPAVTGFTAGVAMSGDLKSPKDSIPKGTLLSIAVGLVVYVGLALLLAFYVDRDLLINDTNFFQKIAWSSPLVIAGIWGATLSSALGGILGAPRILQAMSSDKVTHHFFAKGVGNNNEPRRALILTFLLAEVGILIGELDVIAGIVSMFYIAAYGFINLAYVLERWANSDFRPSMKISIWIGIIGFVASMGVMFKLDTFGMVIALGIMFGIYLFLKRKEVDGNISDVWQSVWTSIIRTSLHRVNRKPLKESNWQPNVILFSGGGAARPHLLDFGVNIAGNQGFLSNFDLHIKSDDTSIFSKADQKVAATIDEKYTGVFTRRQSVSNLYEGIEIISQTYGFSGVEPNTIMMGWARESSEPAHFSQMIYNLTKLDMNIVMLDFDKERLWGKRQTIDIWWRGGGNNGNFALSLAKFMTSSDDWANAKIRLLIINQNSDKLASIYEKASLVLENLRIEAELRIINNEIEQRSFYDIIRLESIDTDLIFLGLTEIEKGNEIEFVNQTNKLCKDIGTVAIIKASSQFKDLSLIDNKDINDQDNNKSALVGLSDNKNISDLFKPIDNEKISNKFAPIVDDIDIIYHEFIKLFISPVFDFQNTYLRQMQGNSVKSFDNLISRAPNNQQSVFRKAVNLQHKFFMRSQLKYVKDNVIGGFDKVFDESIDQTMSNLMDFHKKLANYPYRIKVSLDKARFAESWAINKKHKWDLAPIRVLFIFSTQIPYYIHFRELLSNHYPQSIYQIMRKLVVMINKDNFRFENDIFKTIRKITDVYDHTLELSTESVPSVEELNIQKQQITGFIDELEMDRQKAMLMMFEELKMLFVRDLNHVLEKLNSPTPNIYIDYSADFSSIVKKKKKSLLQSVDTMLSNTNLLNHVNQLNTYLLSFRFITTIELHDLNNSLNEIVNDSFIKPLQALLAVIKDTNKNGEISVKDISERLKNMKFNSELRVQQAFMDQYNYSFKKIKMAVQYFPEQLTIYTDSKMFTNREVEMYPLQKIDVSLRRTVGFMVERSMIEINELLINKGQEFNILKSELIEVIQSINLFNTKDVDENTSLLESNETRLSDEEFISLIFDKAKANLESVIEKRMTIGAMILKKEETLKANSELYPFIRNIQDLKQYIKEEKQRNWFNKIFIGQQVVVKTLGEQINKLWYNQSSGLLLAQKFSKAILESKTRVEVLLDFKNKVSPSATTLNKIPDYYKQLFLRKQFYLNEFWVGRKEELSTFDKSYKQWEAGYSGGIMVVGERISGKSFFANYVSQKYMSVGETYFINPPYEGSILVSDLLSSFRQVTENKGSFNQILNTIPKRSVFFIDDLELWWEKSADGMSVIKQLMNLVSGFGHRHLFVFMGNIHSFNLINKYQNIESNFLSIIELLPFNARELKDIVLHRHQTSSLSFKIEKTLENSYISWNYARLFNTFFKYSEGNAGVTLQVWINSVKEVDANTLILEKPKYPDISLFSFVETDWMIFMMQFILHKRMTKAKLVRVSHENRAEVIKKLRILKRAGLIILLGDDVFDIDPYMLAFLRKALVKQELL